MRASADTPSPPTDSPASVIDPTSCWRTTARLFWPDRSPVGTRNRPFAVRHSGRPRHDRRFDRNSSLTAEGRDRGMRVYFSHRQRIHENAPVSRSAARTWHGNSPDAVDDCRRPASGFTLPFPYAHLSAPPSPVSRRLCNGCVIRAHFRPGTNHAGRRAPSARGTGCRFTRNRSGWARHVPLAGTQSQRSHRIGTVPENARSDDQGRRRGVERDSRPGRA